MAAPAIAHRAGLKLWMQLVDALGREMPSQQVTQVSAGGAQVQQGLHRQVHYLNSRILGHDRQHYLHQPASGG